VVYAFYAVFQEFPQQFYQSLCFADISQVS